LLPAVLSTRSHTPDTLAEQAIWQNDVHLAFIRAIHLMNEAPPIEEIAKRIVAEFHPRRIVLFGSRARGDERADSDLDLLVVMSTDLPAAERIRAVDRLFRPRSWSMDVVVLTPDEAAASRTSRNSLVSIAEREGRVVYERP
jgi:predicted nucleotidyltransferase